MDLKSALQDMVVVTAVRRALLRKEMYEMFEIKGKVATAICYAKVVEDEAIEQIRRMCEALGYRVVKLKRIRIMNIELGNLPTGSYRDVTKEEFETMAESFRK